MSNWWREYMKGKRSIQKGRNKYAKAKIDAKDYKVAPVQVAKQIIYEKVFKRGWGVWGGGGWAEEI